MINAIKHSRSTMMDELKIIGELNQETPTTVGEMFIVRTDYKTLIGSSLKQTMYMFDNKLFSCNYQEGPINRFRAINEEFIKFMNGDIEYADLSFFKRNRKAIAPIEKRIIPEFDYNINSYEDAAMLLSVKCENDKLTKTFIINNGATFACYNKGCEFRRCCYNNRIETTYKSATPARLRSQIILGIIHDMIVNNINDKMTIQEARDITKTILDEYYFNILKVAFSFGNKNKAEWLRFNESNELLDDISILMFDEIAKFIQDIKDIPAYIYTHNTNVHIKLFRNVAINLSNRVFDDTFNTYTAVTQEEADYIMEHKDELEEILNKKIVFCLCALEKKAKCGDCEYCKYNKSLWIIEVLREK